MYQPSYSTSPPYPTAGASPPGTDPYRAAPIALPAKQVYQQAPSPGGGYISPPPPNGFSPMPTAVGAAPGRYQLYSSQPSRPSSSRPYIQNGAQSPAFTPGAVMPQQTPQQRHKGTLAPGQIVKVGDASVRIERYLSEGGYAHVYLTTSDKPIYPPLPKGEEKRGRWGERGYTQHCLKRIAFEDENVWVDVKKEIQVMKSLPPNPHLTQFLGSAHARLPNGGYEVFILMEFCPGGGIIDLLNKRLRDRLKEIEILNIFTDVCEAVAAMHALKTPLLHRDLKIENVLSGPSPTPPTPNRPMPLVFKLCDFGSTTFPSSHPPQSKIEAEALAMDLNKNTTLQYRSPEMVEPMLGWAVGLPSDVWALGVLLYKLCYYTTPFEEHGTLAIVNAKYTFPQYPVYSPRIQHLIASMLVDHPARRPTVFEVLKIAHEMQGTKPEIDYPTPSRSFASPPPQPPKPITQTSGNLLDFTSAPTSPVDASAMAMQNSLISSIQPQRRGRPTRDSAQQGPTPSLPQPPSIPTPSSITTPSLPAPPKLQVTGDRPPASAGGEGRAAEQKKPSLDAFGAPSHPSKQGSASSGFSDAFGAPSGGVGAAASKFGGATRQPSNKFGDSFSPSSRPQTVRAPSSTATPNFPVTFGNDTAKPSNARRPSSSIPDGELSFETRFPSLEALGSPSTETAPPTLISPISPQNARPPLQAKASMMGHLTGDLASPHQTTFGRPNEVPQPRSTQVTGTAFKGIQGGMLSPAPAPKKEYFDGFAPLAGDEQGHLAPSQAAPGKSSPEDLMGGGAADQAGLSAPLLGSGSPSATSKPTLPPLKPPKPDAFGARSPVEKSAVSTRSSGPKSGGTDANSSDDDAGPESASGGHFRRPSSSREDEEQEQSPQSIAQRMSMFEKPGAKGPGTSPTNRNLSPTKPTKSSTTPAQPSGGAAKGGDEKARPQIMFGASGTSWSRPKQVEALPPPKSATTDRPAHERKSSVGEMAARFESGITMPSADAPTTSPVDIGSSPPAETKAKDEPPAKAGPGTGAGPKKPTVAAKPPALRRLTLEQPAEPPASGSAETQKEKEKPPVSPVKPASLSASTFPSTTAGANTSKPGGGSRPPIQKKPSIKHAEMPTVAGYSKSSSGRSFPISKPPPSSNDASAPQDTGPSKNEVQREGGEEGSRSGSPEKPQSVNSLIARWNKGDMGAKEAPAKRGEYI